MDTDSKKTRLCRRWIYACGVFVLFLALYFFLEGRRLRTTINPSGNHAHQYVIRPDPRLDVTDNERKKKILDSTWINLFPNLKHMVTQSGEVLPQQFTSANHTVISINSSSNVMVGGKLYAYISAADELGHAKDYGGDFFLVMLRRPSSLIDGVLCEVLDKMNGFYRVTCILPWSGTAILNAILIHPSESIYQMMRLYSSETPYLMNVTMRETGSNKTENTLCSIGFPEKHSEKLCDYSNPTHGEKWKCLKPASGKCSTITWYNNNIINHTLVNFWDNIYFRKGVNYKIAIQGSGATFRIKKLGHRVVHNHSNDNSSVIQKWNPTSPSGWFYESKWTSNQVTVKPYSVSRLRQCVMNRDFYFIGDSTIKQYFLFFTFAIGVKVHGPDNSISWWGLPGDGVNEKTNSSYHYRAHGNPLRNLGPPISKPYITDTLDSIVGCGERSIVVITIGYHFELFDADVFERRLQLIKVSIRALLKRLPGIKIYIKGLHYHEYSGALCPSPWLTYRYNIIIRHTFKNIEGVIYFPLWDFSVLLDNRPLHPARSVLKKVVELFLSYIC